MLLELNISNFALIDNIKVSLEEGLNVLTGETGAGKSIIIDAVNIVLGERADTEIIRTGAERAMVEALFDYSGVDVIEEMLRETGIEPEPDRTLVLSREIKSGRSISRVNGRAVPLSAVREISKHLIDLHGQHQHQSLLDTYNHLDILDRFGGEDLLNLRAKVESLYSEWEKAKRMLEEILRSERERQRDIDMYSFQVEEIDAAALRPGEDGELSRKREVMINAEKIYQSLAQCYQLLCRNDDMGIAVVDGLNQAGSLLSPFVQMDASIEEFYRSVSSAYYSLKETSRDIRNYLETVEFDQQELNRLEERLDLINKLKRKYGSTIEEVLEYRKQKGKELDRLLNSEQEAEMTRERIEALEKELSIICEGLTKLREETSQRLSERVSKYIRKLGMENGVFSVRMDSTKEFTSKGKDDVEFLFSANLGEPLKPLSKIVSGGEMSRIMLAIKTGLADTDSIPTLIFDEIDVGISGRAAQVVAQQLAEVSRKHQVVCVTHLPQIASMADNHFLIKKEEKDGHTYTRLKVLDRDARIQELARLLGGAQVTDITKQHAGEMLNMAENLKKKH
ncbi:MAG: DNA repair protein RecN [Firmicutes bacterium]|nr:DNA repair protein RecN [Bacillota bacterium]MDI6705382.1 DNA repair protein RecN [Bacillota bacterium]